MLKRILVTSLLLVLLTGCGSDELLSETVNGRSNSGASVKDMLTDERFDDEEFIYTSDVTLDTYTFDDTLATLRSAVTEYGGYIEYEDESNGALKYEGTVERRIELTIRIPSEFVSGFEEELRDIAYLVSRETAVTGVTRKYNSERMHVTSSRNTVDYATFNVELREEDDVPETFQEKVSEAITGAGSSFLSRLQTLIVDFIYTTPYLVVLLLVGLIINLVSKKVKRG